MKNLKYKLVSNHEQIIDCQVKYSSCHKSLNHDSEEISETVVGIFFRNVMGDELRRNIIKITMRLKLLSNLIFTRLTMENGLPMV